MHDITNTVGQARVPDNLASAIAAVKGHGISLRRLKEFQNNSEVVMAAVNENGYALRFASKTLKGDRTIVIEAVKQNWRAILYATDELKNNNNFVLDCIDYSPNTLQYASSKLYDNADFMLSAVNKNAHLLYYASNKIKSNPEIVTAAVKKDGYSLQYASSALKDDPEIVIHAIKSAQNRDVLQHAGINLRGGALVEYIQDKMKRFNVYKLTFVSTILLGARCIREGIRNKSECILTLLRPSTRLPEPFSIQVKRLIFEYAGVVDSKSFALISNANLVINTDTRAKDGGGLSNLKAKKDNNTHRGHGGMGGS